MALNLTALLEGMVATNASDLHLKVGNSPMFRLDGLLRPVDYPSLKPEETDAIMGEILPGRLRIQFEEKGTVDFSYSLPGKARFRINVFHQRGSTSLAIRKVNIDAPNPEDLALPPVVNTFHGWRNGLVLVTGATGSGKSTTLAAVIQEINETRRCHIITIEDPIEFLYRDDKAIVNQLEIGVDTVDFAWALRHVLRQDPDVILVGEIRDQETMKTSLTAVETGHLVFSTLHTPDAKQTINRILNFFPRDEEPLILQQLSLSLRAIMCQRLLARADGKGRTPLCEILIGTPIVSKLLAEGRIADMQQAMRNRDDGMQVFDQHLADLVKVEVIEESYALQACDDEAAFRRMLRGRMSTGEGRGLV
jgi:twitching motility protein PilT